MSSYRFTCIDPCQRSFPEPRNLARHQRVCSSWQNHLTSRAEKRRQLVISQTTVEDGLPAKRQKLSSSSPPDGDPAQVSSMFFRQALRDPDQDDHQSAEEAGYPSTDANPAVRLYDNESGLGDSASPAIAPTSSGLGLCVNSPSTVIHDTTLPPRSHRLPARYREQLPEPPPPLPLPEPRPTLPRVILHVYDKVQSNFNKFGVARLYHHRPSYDPDSLLTADQLSNIVNHLTRASDSDNDNPRPSLPTCFVPKLPPWPWQNMSMWRLMSWGASRSHEKSHSEMTRLVNDVLKADDFCINDLPSNFNASREYQKLDHAMHGESQGAFSDDGWQESSVRIPVPTGIKDAGNGARPFDVPNLFHRSITSVIRAAFSESTAKLFHLTPFKRIWRSPTSGREQRIYDELYCSNAWNDEHDRLQKEERDDGCELERVIAGLMFWSDATQLAQFGQVKAWPVYLFFGNLSKYIRGSPSSGACHPIAFIPSVGHLHYCYALSVYL